MEFPTPLHCENYGITGLSSKPFYLEIKAQRQESSPAHLNSFHGIVGTQKFASEPFKSMLMTVDPNHDCLGTELYRGIFVLQPAGISKFELSKLTH